MIFHTEIISSTIPSLAASFQPAKFDEIASTSIAEFLAKFAEFDHIWLDSSECLAGAIG